MAEKSYLDKLFSGIDSFKKKIKDEDQRFDQLKNQWWDPSGPTIVASTPFGGTPQSIQTEKGEIEI